MITIFELTSVNYDNFIPLWHTSPEKITTNVLVLVIQGSVLYKLNNENIVAEKGDLLFIPKHTLRTGNNYKSNPHQKYTILFDNNGSQESEIPFIKNGIHLKFKVRDIEYFKQRFSRLYYEFSGDKRFSTTICQGILQELLGIIARELQTIEIPPMKLKYATEIREFIIENYRTTIEVEHLAKLINKSINYTISVFKEIYGQTPIQYVHHLRISEACYLLNHTEMTIVNIAEYLGYYDHAYLTKTFKKYMLISPKDYRMNNHERLRRG